MSRRDQILDAAARLMQERGLAAATTKEIAKEAGCAESLLYKYFTDKQEIFLAVLQERMPPVDLTPRGSDLRENLEQITRQLLAFYVQAFPMAASIFSTPQLLAIHRERVREYQAGPEKVVKLLAEYLNTEQIAGRIGAGVDVYAVAQLLVGAAMQQAFFACFEGESEVPQAEILAQRLVAALPLTTQ